MKSYKIYIIAAIALICGLILLACGFALSGFNLNRLDTTQSYEEKNFVSSGKIKTIIIDDSNTAVKISVSSDDKFRMTYYENDKEYYKINENNDGTLTVQKENNRRWYDYIFNIKLLRSALSARVPADFNGKITVKTSNGTIIYEDVVSADAILKTSNGSIDIKNIKSSSMLDVHTSNGNISIYSATAAGKVKCETSNGKIELASVECDGLTADSSNGHIALFGVKSAENIELRTSNGWIEYDTSEFGKDLILITSNSDIGGTIAGSINDYAIRSQTSNGRNSLPENAGSGNKTIYVKTSNGDIEIDFAE